MWLGRFTIFACPKNVCGYGLNWMELLRLWQMALIRFVKMRIFLESCLLSRKEARTPQWAFIFHVTIFCYYWLRATDMDIIMWEREACYWLVKLVMINGQSWDSLPHQRLLVLWDSNKTSVSILSMVLTCWKECTLLYAWNSQLSFTILDRHIGLFMEFTWYMLPITKWNSISECLNVQCIGVKRNSDQYLFFSFFVHFNMEVIPMYTWKATKNLKSLIYCLWNHVIYLWWCASMCMAWPWFHPQSEQAA